MNRIFLLVHQDEEVGVFTQVKEGIIKNNNIYILTNGNLSKLPIIVLSLNEKKKA